MARSKQTTRPVVRRSLDQIRANGIAKLRRVIRDEQSIIDRLKRLDQRLLVIRERGGKVRETLIRSSMTDDMIRQLLSAETVAETVAETAPLVSLPTSKPN